MINAHRSPADAPKLSDMYMYGRNPSRWAVSKKSICCWNRGVRWSGGSTSNGQNRSPSIGRSSAAERLAHLPAGLSGPLLRESLQTPPVRRGAVFGECREPDCTSAVSIPVSVVPSRELLHLLAGQPVK